MSILVVDDSLYIRMLLKSFLHSGGYLELLFAENSSEAFGHLGITGSGGSPERIDLILMDIMMPDTDGIETCRQIQAIRHLQDIPIIMVTGDPSEESLEQAFEAGAVDYITKPLRKVELLARVYSALRLKREIDYRKAREKELQEALTKVKTLSGFLPICANCKKIRNDDGYWEQIEVYIKKHSEADFSHGICNDCARILYPELYDKLAEKEGYDT